MTKIILLAVAISLSSCVVPGARYAELPLPPVPIEHPAFSLLPPAENGWAMANLSKYNLSMARIGNSKDETYAIQVILLRVPAFSTDDEFKAYVDKGFREDTDQKRFNLIKNNVSMISTKNGKCVKNITSMEDAAPKKMSGEDGSMILDVVSFTCKFPDVGTAAANISYSHRHMINNSDSLLESKADAVFSNFTFKSPGK